LPHTKLVACNGRQHASTLPMAGLLAPSFTNKKHSIYQNNCLNCLGCTNYGLCHHNQQIFFLMKRFTSAHMVYQATKLTSAVGEYLFFKRCSEDLTA